MIRYKIIHIFASLKSMFITFFGSKYTLIILDAIVTTIISIHTANIDLDSDEWIKRLIFYVIISILLNMICVWADYLKTKHNTLLELFSVVYEIHNKINSNTSTKLYRVNKKVVSSIRNNKLAKGEINSIADFQTLSFDICKELYTFVSNNCKCEESEITIFQRFTDDEGKDFVTMIAYKNSQNRQPATYGEKFYLNSKKKKQPVFVDIFKDVNAEVKILHSKKYVKKEFNYLNSSKSREEKICQYIGIPIRTNRKKVEILLQIDVSQKRVFGMRYNTVKTFAEDIFLPFANLLYCSYERDLVLNKFYDVLEENISQRRRN